MLVVTDKGRFLEPQNCFNHCSEKKKKGKQNHKLQDMRASLCNRAVFKCNESPSVARKSTRTS